MKKIISTMSMLSATYILFAQDSTINELKKPYDLVTPDKKGYSYPFFKPLSVSYGMFGKSNYTSDYKDQPFEEGSITTNYRVKVFGNYRVFAKNKISVSASVNYLHESFKTAPTNNFLNVDHVNSLSIDDISLGISTAYRSMLFNKPVLYNASIILDSRNLVSVQKVRGMLGATLIVKRTTTTAISAGLIAIIDPSVQFPFFPTFSYWHKFSGGNWEFDAIVPAKLMFRRSNTFKGWLSLGTEFNGNSFFNPKEISRLPGNYEVNYSEIMAGLTYEHPLNKFLLAGVKTGIKKTITSRMGKVNAKRSNYLIQGNANAAPYINFSLSFMIPAK